MSQYHREVGKYLSTFTWTFFGTVTFSRPVSVIRAVKYVEEYLDWHPRCFAFYAIEKKPYGEVHAHLLIGRVTDLVNWGLGRSEIQPYDKEKGGCWYASKQMIEWNLWGAFPKAKPANASRWWREGCTLDPTNIVGLMNRD